MSERFRIVKIGSGSYIFDSYIFNAAILILLFTALMILSIYGFDKSEKLYVACNTGDGSKCWNAVYGNMQICGKSLPDNDYLCTTEYLPDGFVYGVKPPNVILYFLPFSIVVLIIGFLLNHFLYNNKVKVE